MRWISKHPPKYAWDGDQWYNETDKSIYTCFVKEFKWKSADAQIEFPDKTMLMDCKDKSGRFLVYTKD